MKKVILSLTALAFVTVVFTSCKEQSNFDMLTTKKGWKLVEATCSPAYELLDGSKITNLQDGYLAAWELDDIIIFDESGALTVDPGKNLPPEGKDGWIEKKAIGTWAFLENETKIRMQIPFWYPATPGGVREPDEVKLNLLDKDNLRVSLTFRECASCPEYTFSLAYAINK